MDLIRSDPWTGAERSPVAATTLDQARADAEALVAAAPAWRSDARQRAERLRALASVCEARRGELIDLLIHEAGKTRADAEAEAALLPKKIAITLEHLAPRTPATITATMAGSVWRPRGLSLVLGPSNFPLHLLHGLVVPALAVGCTVLAKPSERCPALGAAYARCLEAADLAGVCRVVQGDARLVDDLLDLDHLAVVAAIGGVAMGEALHRRLAGRTAVILALELGGVNHALVRSDADADATAVALADGAWRMAGQRCTATRVVHVPAADLDGWLRRLGDLRRQWRPGASPEALAGPMIDAAAAARFRAGFTDLPAGIRLVAGDLTGDGTRVDPLLLTAADADSPWLQVERFGPALVVCPYRDEATAVAAMQANPWRLSCSIFTRDDAAFTRLATVLTYGIVNRNRPTAGARSDLPFGGCGRSGNGRPAALAAAQIFADETVVWG